MQLELRILVDVPDNVSPEDAMRILGSIRSPMLQSVDSPEMNQWHVTKILADALEPFVNQKSERFWDMTERIAGSDTRVFLSVRVGDIIAARAALEMVRKRSDG